MEFAPVNTTGNFRSLKFIKYLREFNIEPIVVTFKEAEGAEYFSSKIDPGLLSDIPEGTSIYRVHCEDGTRFYGSRLQSFLTIYFSIKDSFARRWRKFLLPELDEIIKRHQPKMIITSLPPYSAGMLTVEVSRKYKLPMIVDMRDLYARWGNNPFGSIIHYWLTYRDEKKIFSHAVSIIGVTPQLLQIFKSSHPSISPLKFHLIPNGFDVMNDLLPDFSFAGKKGKVVIGYVGSFYYQPESREQIFKPWWKKRGHKMLTYTPVKEDWLYRSPYFFLKAISILFQDQPQYRKIVSIEFVGRIPDWLHAMVKEFKLVSSVTLHGFVSHEEASNIQRNFDVMLATSEKVLEEEHYSLPSKIFDYVVQSKPILGFVTNGIQKDFILESGAGIICDPDQPEEAARQIQSLLESGMHFTLNNQYLQTFKRRNLTQKLANLILKNMAK